MVSIGRKRLTSGDFEKVLYQHERSSWTQPLSRKSIWISIFSRPTPKTRLFMALIPDLARWPNIKSMTRINVSCSITWSEVTAPEPVIFLQKIFPGLRCWPALMGWCKDHLAFTRIRLKYWAVYWIKKSVLVSFSGVALAPAVISSQLAHLALNLIGEGEMLVEGKLQVTSEIFKKEKLHRSAFIFAKELRCSMETSAMTGVGMVNIIHAKKIVNLAVTLSAITNELMKSFDESLLPRSWIKWSLMSVSRKSPKGMRNFLHDSKLIRKRPDHLYHAKINEAVFTDKSRNITPCVAFLRCLAPCMTPLSMRKPF